MKSTEHNTETAPAPEIDAMDLREQLRRAQEELKRLRELAQCKRSPGEGLGGEIQRRREAKGLGIRELARRSGVSYGLIAKAERKAVPNITLHALYKLAAVLEVSAVEMLKTVRFDWKPLGGENF